jgi:hypothetical protein
MSNLHGEFSFSVLSAIPAAEVDTDFLLEIPAFLAYP